MTTQPTILVTGGASGIGFAIVEAVLAAGWRAIAVDVDAGHLASARKTLGERAELRFEQLDVADDDAVVKSIAACEREFGPLSGGVNSAGIARDVPTLETSGVVPTDSRRQSCRQLPCLARSGEGDGRPRRRRNCQPRLDIGRHWE
jgi:NAD(P)-dependent dehydrogenase (short-subunit alcohol dehydrogenase family)